jgi:hypothetical protein
MSTGIFKHPPCDFGTLDLQDRGGWSLDDPDVVEGMLAETGVQLGNHVSHEIQ